MTSSDESANVNKRTSFTPIIEPYYGNLATLNFFTSQLNDLKDINNWSDHQTLLYFKSKLTGGAGKFFLQYPEI